ncbi:MAG: TerC family protein [Coriobacteriales bacterium]|nr:TerC family protein [Coriobacteriales bacterium]
MDLSVFLEPSSWVAILTLSLLEIVLGIDNLVFIAILTSRLPREQQPTARRVGLIGALIMRIGLLFSLSWIAQLTTPLVPPFELMGHHVVLNGRALILFLGGLFLIYKAVTEIYHKVELHDEGVRTPVKAKPMGSTIATIMLMDIIFSLDSVITAVGMVDQIALMIAGVIIAMVVMVVFADAVSEFINKYASLKILALAFLLMIGTLLTAEALEFTVPKGFVYFAMFFSLAVELIQIRYEANLEKHTAEEVA